MDNIKKLITDKRVRLALALVITIVLVICAVKVIGQQRDYAAGDDIYADAMQAAGIVMPTAPATTAAPAKTTAAFGTAAASTAVSGTDSSDAASTTAAPAVTEPPAPVKVLTEADLPALQEINPDVLGWIMIPDTNISYPLLQGTDNDYYLNHTWNKNRNSAGSIFLEAYVSPNFTDFNTIIYGHRMNNGSMFTGLRKFEDLSYWEQHPSVFIRGGDDVVRQYDIYAAYEAAIGEITYGLAINDKSTRERFIQHGIDSSVIDTGIVPTHEDHIVTLVTCTGHGHASRWVVQAVLHVDESAIPDREPDVISTGRIEAIIQFIPADQTTKAPETTAPATTVPETTAAAEQTTTAAAG